ncbi:MAG: type I methionyl aminopeptidase, partial [Candidatus Nomurabacteria bacterium]|nr:type I methionyl aminopeptidase [Candidatus Nomurabacteria bacterium]
VNALALDKIAQKKIAEFGDTPAFLGYAPEGVPVKYPAALCVSVNDQVVHGIPAQDIILKDGDIVSIDCGLTHNGLFTDHAITVPVGKISAEAHELISVTHEALNVGIAAAQPGNTVGDIGYAIQTYIESQDAKYGIVRELTGHGVGVEIHEDPYIFNFGKPGQGAVLKPGMVVAIEPMITLGKPAVNFWKDHYTVATADGSLSAHFEHTVVITENGVEVLTI